MDAELKIVGSIIIALMFFANTGIGVWIYRIMKASERIKEVDKLIEKNAQDIVTLEKQLSLEKENLNEKITKERELRIKHEARINQVEKDTENLKNDLSKNYITFTDIINEFKISINKLNSSLEHFSNVLMEVKSDLKDIKKS